MEVLISSVIFLQFIMLIFITFHTKGLRAKLSSAERKCEQLQSQLRVAERDVSHSQAMMHVYKENSKFSVAIFTEEEVEKGWLQNSRKIRVKSQIYQNGLPIGAAWTLKEDSFTEVNSEKLEKIVQEHIMPLLKAGVDVINMLDSSKMGAVGAIAQGVGKSNFGNR